jgi:threonine/homoserine/homoserine lactone efflux protein
MLESLISFTMASILLAFSPGPDNLYVITQSLANGTKSGIATTLGLVSGCIVHTTLLAFGVSAIISASYTIFYILKVIGALYLIYLAYQVLSTETSLNFNANVTKKSTAELFKQFYILGIVFMLISFIIFSFLAFLAGYISLSLAKNKNFSSLLKWLQFIVFIGIAIFILIP